MVKRSDNETVLKIRQRAFRRVRRWYIVKSFLANMMASIFWLVWSLLFIACLLFVCVIFKLLSNGG